MKKIILFVGMLIMGLSFTACSNVKDEEIVKEELKSVFVTVIDETEIIDEIEIVERNVYEDSKEDWICCKVESNDGWISYTRYFKVLYRYDDYDKEWTYSTMSEDNDELWTKKPIKGVGEETILYDLYEKWVIASDEFWGIWKSNVKEMTVEKQETNLETYTDVVTISLVLEEGIQEAKGQLVLTYKFDDEWQFEEMSGEEEFEAITKPEMALNVTEEDLMAEIVKCEFEYGTSRLQTIEINASEVTEFGIDSHICTEKGTWERYDCSLKIINIHGEFDAKAIVIYKYMGSDGWTLQTVRVLRSDLYTQ